MRYHEGMDLSEITGRGIALLGGSLAAFWGPVIFFVGRAL